MILQKRLGGRVLKCSPRRVLLQGPLSEEVRGAITRGMIRGLVKKGILVKAPVRGSSRGRARLLHTQKMKGRRRGPGSRQGTKTARRPAKDSWMHMIRVQREFLLSLRKSGALSRENFSDAYRKSQGGFFRSKRHIYIYLKERGFIK